MADQDVDTLTWWALKGEKAAKALVARCERACADNAERRARAILFGSAIEGCTLTTFNGPGYDLVSSEMFKILETPIIRNTLRSIAGTLLSKLFCTDSPLPQAMSDGGDWTQRAKAEDIDQFLECEYNLPQGEFNNSNDMWNHAGFLSMVVGSVAIFVLPGWDQVEMHLDDTLNMGIDRSGRWGAIRTVVRTAWADPEEMVFNNLRKHKQAILDSVETLEDPLEATRVGRGTPINRQRMVRYYQGWRCKVRDRDGHHLTVLKNGTVLDAKPYKRPEPPCVLFHWERQLAGEWGTPLVQTLFEEFIRQNERLADVDHMVANSPGVIVAAPKEVHDELGGQAKGVQKFETSYPEKLKIFIPEKLDRQGLELAKEHEMGVHNASGVNQAQTSASKALGTRSGLHEELVAHLFSERFADHQRRLTYAKVEATARRFLWAAQDMVEMGHQDFIRQWKSKDGRTYRTLNVSDLDLDSSRYVFSIAAVSEDKNRPETRAKKADEYLRLQLIQGSEWLQAQRDLDVPATVKLSNQQFEWVEAQIRKWSREPIEELPRLYKSPRKLIDPKTAGRQVALAAMKAEEAGCPRERIAYFDRFIDECVVLARNEAKEAAQTGQALPGTTNQLEMSGGATAQ